MPIYLIEPVDAKLEAAIEAAEVPPPSATVTIRVAKTRPGSHCQNVTDEPLFHSSFVWKLNVPLRLEKRLPLATVR